MQRTLAQLQNECQKLGLEVKQSGKRPAKADYVKALREHHMPEGGLPYEELTPMLCFAEWNLKPEEQRNLWQHPDWWAQEKLNGCRVILHFVKDVGVFAHSRTTSLKTYRMSELTGKLLFASWAPEFDAVVDCEAKVEKPVDSRPYTAKGEVTETSLHSTTVVLSLEDESSRKLQKEQDAPLVFNVIDLVKIGARDLKKRPLWERDQALDGFMDTLSRTDYAQYFKKPAYVKESKRAFWERIIEAGGEGIVFKNCNSRYEDSSSRRRDGWVKAKKRVEYDAFVTGFIRGEEGSAWRNLVGALEFSVYIKETGKTHAIAMVSSIPMDLRKRISKYDPTTDTVTMDESMLNEVAEVSGQEITPRVYRLSHATIEKWRNKEGDVKYAAECTVSMEDLKVAAFSS